MYYAATRSAVALMMALPLMAVASAHFDPLASLSVANGGCTQRLRSIDDQADLDVRDANQRIVRLRRELALAASVGPPVASETQANLVAAVAQRADILQRQHTELNEVRRQCDILRAKRGSEGAR